MEVIFVYAILSIRYGVCSWRLISRVRSWYLIRGVCSRDIIFSGVCLLATFVLCGKNTY